MDIVELYVHTTEYYDGDDMRIWEYDLHEIQGEVYIDSKYLNRVLEWYDKLDPSFEKELMFFKIIPEEEYYSLTKDYKIVSQLSGHNYKTYQKSDTSYLLDNCSDSDMEIVIKQLEQVINHF